MSDVKPSPQASGEDLDPNQLVLFDCQQSGSCYKVRLVLAALNLPCRRVELDLVNGEARAPAFLAVNPLGKVPVLALGGGEYLSESHAIMLYLADGSALIPKDPWLAAQMRQWLCFEQQWIDPTIGTAHFWLQFRRKVFERSAETLAEKQGSGQRSLEVLDGHLAGREWLVGDQVSLADLSLYSYVHVSNEAGVSLAPFAHVRRWLERTASRPDHVRMDATSPSKATSVSA